MIQPHEPAIKAVGLGKTYQKGNSVFHALENLDFELQKGEVLGIIGQNGSGKSTLLRILSGITKPSAGYVDVFGSVASILDIGTGIHPDLTGKQNVYLRGQLLGMGRREIDAVYDELLEFSGVKDFIDSPVKHYSSGMFLRLAFSIIVHLNYDILLLDEVLAVGDEAFRRKCADKIQTIVSSGKTVVMVSHDLRSIMELCTRTMLLKNGKLVAFNTPISVVRDSYLAKMAGMDPDGELIVGETDISKFCSEEIGFKVLGLRVFNQDGNSADSFPTDKDVFIELHYRIENEDVQMAIGITDFLSNRLIDDSPIIELKRNEESFKGEFIVTWTLKQGLFNPGQYFLSMYAIDGHLKTVKRYERVLNFSYAAGGSQRGGEYDVLRAAFNIDLAIDVKRI